MAPGEPRMEIPSNLVELAIECDITDKEIEALEKRYRDVEFSGT